jgi:tetratricopeptide (TPR) repeat protein
MGKTGRRDLDRALELSMKERWDEAIAKLEILETSADTEVRDLALNYLADAYAATGRNADAEAMLRRSIEGRGTANDGLGSPLAVLAPVVMRQGRVDEAEQIYLHALEVQRPDGPEIKVITMRNLAYLYWSTGRQDRARGIYAALPQCDERFLADLSGIMKPYLEPAIPV